MHSDPEKFSGRWEAASEFKPAPDFHGSGTLSTSSGSSQSEASSTFSSQNGDSPTTSLSSVATSPSLSQDSGKLRRSSELSNADEDLPDPLNGPASKKCRLDDSGARATHADPAPKPGRGCAALRISRALFVENLVGAYRTKAALLTPSRCGRHDHRLDLGPLLAGKPIPGARGATFEHASPGSVCPRDSASQSYQLLDPTSSAPLLCAVQRRGGVSR